jgi:YVTN family beta-propeller protein
VWTENVGDGTVSEIDASTGAVVNTIAVAGFGLSSDGTDVWVASIGDGSLTEIDASSGTVVRTIELGGEPWGVSSDGTHVWVSLRHESEVIEIDPSTGTVVNTIPLGAFAYPKGISSDGTHVWVAESNGRAVAEIDASSGTLVATIGGVGYEPLEVSSDGTRVWVSNYEGIVSEIDASTGTLINSMFLGGSLGGEAKGLSSDGTHVWAASWPEHAVTEVPTTFTPECAGNTGTVKLVPGVSNTATVQTLKIKGALTGCVGANFTGGTYKVTLKTAAPVSCAALQEPGEPATASAKYKWAPHKKADGLEGPLSMPLTEAPGAPFSGETTAPGGRFVPWTLALSGTVSESFTGVATCGEKPVKKGTFSGSGVNLSYHE